MGEAQQRRHGTHRKVAGQCTVARTSAPSAVQGLLSGQATLSRRAARTFVDAAVAVVIEGVEQAAHGLAVDLPCSTQVRAQHSKTICAI